MDTIVKGSDRTLSVRLQNPDGSPFDLSTTTEIQANFLNDDLTILTLSSEDLGAPIEITVAQAGKLTISLEADETSLLKAQDPAPFSMVLTTSNGMLVVNIKDQLVVEDEVNAP
jgi:hypothetical protein